MTENSRVVVFGGSGFLGSHVCDKLSDYGHRVCVFDMKPSPFLRDDQGMIQGDILDEVAVNSAVAGCDVVYNFAGQADLDGASTDPVLTARMNVLGNMHIMQAAVRHQVKQYIYASTIYVYSDSGGFYRCSKQASEIFLEEYRRVYGLRYTILRYGTLYGPRADGRNAIYRYIKSALEDSEILLEGSGQEIREYIHVRDAAKISAKVLAPDYYDKRFVITGHQAIPVNQMVDMIREILRKPIEIRPREDKKNSHHYKITPYSFAPKIGEKFAPDIFTDMGQGLIECMAEILENSK